MRNEKPLMTNEKVAELLEMLQNDLENNEDFYKSSKYGKVIIALGIAIDKFRNEPNNTELSGYWIRTGSYFAGAYSDVEYVECSCCHEESLEEGNYCPNCGSYNGEKVRNKQ